MHLPGIEEPLIQLLFTVWKDTEEEALAALKPAEESHPPGAMIELFAQATNLPDQYKIQAAANPSNHWYEVDNAWIRDDADVSAVLKEAWKTLPNRTSYLLW